MKIYVRMLDNTAHDLEVEGSDTIGSLKAKIMEKEGVPPQQQLLFFADQELEDARTLADHGVEDGASVCLIAINMQG